MTDVDDERAEAAFRRTLMQHGADVEVRELAPQLGRRRRTALIAVGAAAAAVVAIVVPVVLLRGDGGVKPSDPTSSTLVLAEGMRWVGYRGIEVQVPQDWPFDNGPGRPDCIEPVDAGPPRGEGVPTNPYVEIYPSGLSVTLQGCHPDADVRGPEQFGELPVVLWQPYVQFSDAATMGNADGEWKFQGWTLTVDTVDDIRISILAGPASDSGLSKQVLGSLRRVKVDTNGCETTSPVQAGDFARPDGPAVPAAEEVDSVGICKYERVGTSQPGLVGSRRIEGSEAQRLAAVIQDAPTTPGPDDPRCGDDRWGDFALTLRFFDTSDAPIGEAYVYYDSCFGNGIFDTLGARALTADNCPPLFASAPVMLGSGSRQIFRVCYP